MRLIDADKLRGHKPFTIRGGPIGDYYEGYSDCAMEADEAVQNAPTVDAVPVVRCRECVHLGHVHDFMGLEIESFQCGRTNAEVKLDDFCRYGEREDE